MKKLLLFVAIIGMLSISGVFATVLNVTGNNSYNSSAISGFNATIQNGSGTWNITATGTNASFDFSTSSLYNISISKDNYFSNTTNNINVSSYITTGTVVWYNSSACEASKSGANGSGACSTTSGTVTTLYQINLTGNLISTNITTGVYFPCGVNAFEAQLRITYQNGSTYSTATQTQAAGGSQKTFTGWSTSTNVTSIEFRGRETGACALYGGYDFNYGQINYSVNNGTLYSPIDLKMTPYTAVRAFSAVGSSVINNFTIEYTNNANSSDTGTYVTTNGLVYIPLFNSSYSVSIYDVFNASNTYTNGSVTLTASPYLQGYNFSLYRVNTVNVSFYDLNTLARVNVVNLSMVGNTVTYNFATTTGSIQQEVLNPDTYRMTATAANYSPSTVFLTLSGDNQTVNMYFDSSLTAITFSVQDTLGNTVQNASITITYNINGTYVTFAQAISDVFGSAVILLDQSTQYFITVTHPDYAVFSGAFTPSDTTYLISLQPASSSTYTSLFQYASLQVEFDYDNNTSQLLITYDTVSGSGAIDYFGINASYNGVLYEQNVSGSAGGGTIVLNITPATSSIQDLVNATYWLKVNGYDLYTAEKFFRLTQSSPGNTTLGGGLFESPEQGLGSGGRAILGTIIVLIAVGIGMALGNGNITAGAIVGAAVAGGLTFGSFALFETTYGVLAVVLLIIIAIGDNI